MEKQRIIDWTEAHRDEYLADLAKLVAIRSVAGRPQENMPYGEGPAQALALGLALCEDYGFAVKNYENHVGSADLAPEKPPMLDILAHLDVVGEGDGWETDPYTMTIKDDGGVYGRGVSDDKGGLLAAAYAMRCVKELGVPLAYNCRLVLGCDEENGMGDIAHYFETNKSAPCTATPDADFPVYNVERGFFRLRFRKTLAPAEVLPRVKEYHGGFQLNVVPADASAWFVGMDELALRTALLPLAAELGVSYDVEPDGEALRLTVHGKGCHAAYPEGGINGNTALVRLLCELPLADCDSTRALQALNALLPHGDWLGKALGIAMEDELSGALTCSFTQLHFDEQALWGTVDARVSLCATEENCRAVATERFAEAGFVPDSVLEAGHYTPEDTEFVQTLLKSYTDMTGKPGKCCAMGGGTYVHRIPGGVAFGPKMPDCDTHLHGANEFMPVEHLMQCIEIYAAVIAELCGA